MKISYLLCCILCILSLSCSQKKGTITNEVSEEWETEDSLDKKEKIVKETITSADSTFIKSIIQQLKGIEKFAVQEDFYLLSSLLEPERRL